MYYVTAAEILGILTRYPTAKLGLVLGNKSFSMSDVRAAVRTLTSGTQVNTDHADVVYNTPEGGFVRVLSPHEQSRGTRYNGIFVDIYVVDDSNRSLQENMTYRRRIKELRLQGTIPPLPEDEGTVLNESLCTPYDVYMPLRPLFLRIV